MKFLMSWDTFPIISFQIFKLLFFWAVQYAIDENVSANIVSNAYFSWNNPKTPLKKKKRREKGKSSKPFDNRLSILFVCWTSVIVFSFVSILLAILYSVFNLKSENVLWSSENKEEKNFALFKRIEVWFLSPWSHSVDTLCFIPVLLEPSTGYNNPHLLSKYVHRYKS